MISARILSDSHILTLKLPNIIERIAFHSCFQLTFHEFNLLLALLRSSAYCINLFGRPWPLIIDSTPVTCGRAKDRDCDMVVSGHGTKDNKHGRDNKLNDHTTVD